MGIHHPLSQKQLPFKLENIELEDIYILAMFSDNNMPQNATLLFSCNHPTNSSAHLTFQQD